MKRRTKKLVLPLLLSGVLIGSNVCYVCAQGQIADITSDIETPTGENLPGGGVNEQTVQPEQTETGTQIETTQPDAGEQTGETAQTETGTQIEGTTATDVTGTETGVTETETDVTETETDVTTPEIGNEADTGEGTENPDTTDNGVLPDGTAAADETENVSENAFVNENGEEVLPSTLVGIDYNTISEIYDGAVNVKKQYAFSDAYEKDTIIDCCVDEDGNMVMTISLGASKEDTTGMEARESNRLEALLGGSSAPAPAIDGTFSGWDNIPVSYEYNWDNSENCWQWGNWVTDPVTGEQVCYKTEAGTYDGDVRHVMQLYCDGDNVYLRIAFATIYEAHANGEDFNFYFDQSDTGAKFQITYPETADTLTNSTPGASVYKVDVRNGDTSNSYTIVDGAEAYYLVTDSGINNQLELKIPLEALKTQLREKGIEVSDNFSVLEYTTPNLMYRRIATAGSPTGSVPFAAAVFLLVPTSYIYIKKKDKKEMAFA